MKSKIGLYILVCCVMTITGCGKNNKSIPVDVIDFGHIAAAASIIPDENNIDSAKRAALTYPEQFNTMLTIMGIEPTNDDVELWLNSPVVKAFAGDVEAYAPGHEEITNWISYTINAASHNNLTIPVTTFATAIWGRPQSILFADSTMLIGLNHYLGSDHQAYASLPVYRRRSKSQSTMKYDIAEAIIATSYPYPQDGEGTIANRLMYEGAMVMAKMKLVEDPEESAAMEYNAKEIDWLKKNEGNIWKKMLAGKIIFDQSDVLADKLFAPSPATTVIASDAPGRVGRFIGYQLIKSFFDANPDVSLSDYLGKKMYLTENPLIGIDYTP